MRVTDSPMRSTCSSPAAPFLGPPNPRTVPRSELPWMPSNMISNANRTYTGQHALANCLPL